MCVSWPRVQDVNLSCATLVWAADGAHREHVVRALMLVPARVCARFAEFNCCENQCDAPSPPASNPPGRRLDMNAFVSKSRELAKRGYSAELSLHLIMTRAYHTYGNVLIHCVHTA